MDERWPVELRILRGRPGERPRYDRFCVEVHRDAYILDAVEAVWRHRDPSLIFRHACHHASCGSCGIRINGREKLPCITPVAEYPRGRPITLEPLRNLPWVADLLVDVSSLMARLAEVGAPIVRVQPDPPARVVPGLDRLTRFEDCIECGLCVSACPIAGMVPGYLGPAVLAVAERSVAEPRGADAGRALEMALGPQGVWRCRDAFECSEVCPQGVNPAAAIGRLRRLAVARALGKGSLADASSG